MYFQIKEIILWPRNEQFLPRRLPFQQGKVNVITGTSKTGKSAIIPIIDYCLGSGRCSIPVRTIRDACSWFGIRVQTSNGEWLFARREPGDHKLTGDMFVLEGQQVEPPRSITAKNSSVTAVKQTLDELSGLTDLGFDAGVGSSGYLARPSFRDLVAFIFQPQSIIANPNVLFYKAETHEHQQKLRSIVPLVIGAVTPAILAKQHELEQLKQVFRKKQREVTALKEVSRTWLAEMQSKVLRAKELGLLPADRVVPETAALATTLLKQIANANKSETNVTTAALDSAVVELQSLEAEESQLYTELSKLRRRMSEMSRLKDAASDYRGALEITRDRLKLSDWLRSIHSEKHMCPVCGTESAESSPQLEQLSIALKGIETEAGDFHQIPVAFDREFQHVKHDIAVILEKIDALKIRKGAVTAESERAKRFQTDATAVARFLGELAQALEYYEKATPDSKTLVDLEALREEIAELESTLSPQEDESRKQRALKRLSHSISTFLPLLDAERPNDPVSFLINDLSIKVSGQDREDYLWEIGSGANWLAYHIAVSLAFQTLSSEIKHSPIPGFLVYDQPSQVYFPKILAPRREDNAEIDPAWRDVDVDAVRKVFETLANSVAKQKGNLQVLVLDHAPESVWQNIENVELVEEWRNGLKLVPEEWVADLKS